MDPVGWPDLDAGSGPGQAARRPGRNVEISCPKVRGQQLCRASCRPTAPLIAHRAGQEGVLSAEQTARRSQQPRKEPGAGPARATPRRFLAVRTRPETLLLHRPDRRPAPGDSDSSVSRGDGHKIWSK